MIINELLVNKYRTQKKLDEIANHDLNKYVENAHSKVQELSVKLGLKLKYGTPNQPEITNVNQKVNEI
jgi:hypothetical protein